MRTATAKSTKISGRRLLLIKPLDALRRMVKVGFHTISFGTRVSLTREIFSRASWRWEFDPVQHSVLPRRR
jgi:hypothetical protein